MSPQIRVCLHRGVFACARLCTGALRAPLILIPSHKVLLQEPQKQLWMVETNPTWMVGEATSPHPLRGQ